MHSLPKDFETLERKHIEVFLSPDLPILSMEAEAHPDPQTAYVAQELEGVPFITSKLSGYRGYAQHFFELLGPGLEGE